MELVPIESRLPFLLRTRSKNIFTLIVSIAAALAQFRMIGLVMGGEYGQSIDAAEGVVIGTPHWEIYQSRVLGPYTVYVLSSFFDTFASAYVFFVIVTTAIGGYLVVTLASRRASRVLAWGSFFLFHLQIAMLLSKPWLYTWDHYDLIILTAFVHFILSEKSWRWFSVLFVFAIFNRESAFFISLWMLINPLTSYSFGRSIGQRFDRGMLISGGACAAAGLMLVSFLRSHLLVREIGSEMFQLPALAGKSVQYELDGNIELIRWVFSNLSFSFEILVPLYLLLPVVMAYMLVRRDPRRYLGLAITCVSMVISIALFAVLRETRVLLELVPFVTFLFLELNKDRTAKLGG